MKLRWRSGYGFECISTLTLLKLTESECARPRAQQHRKIPALPSMLRPSARGSWLRPKTGALPWLGFAILLCAVALATAQTIGNHTAVYDTHGVLLPWTSWR